MSDSSLHASDWLPTASQQTLRIRGRLLAAIRQFFADRQVLEVDTPHLARCANPDPTIACLSVAGQPSGYLQSSPEYPMKRLLAAGSGPIYQLAHVFRGDEQGHQHLAEFMMLEWYRPGWNIQELMSEIEALLRYCADALDLSVFLNSSSFAQNHYEARLADLLGCNPLDATAVQLRQSCVELGVAIPESLSEAESRNRDFWLDLLMGCFVESQLGREQPEFLSHYPASQAALAQISADDPRCALRFELFWQGTELANGFQELTDSAEQRARFQQELEARQLAGLFVPELDENFLTALDEMPACAGVALGVDRLLMLLLGQEELSAVVAFPAPV